MTKQREAILDVIRREKRHYTADEIFALSRLKLPTISRATVYNNLHALTESGHIRHVRTMAGADYYDKTPTPHEHALCTVCGKLIDADLEGFAEILQKNTALPIVSYDLILHTVCPACDSKK